MHESAEALITVALAEDLGEHGDLTTNFFVAPEAQATGEIVARVDGVLAGTEVAVATFKRVDPSLKVELLARDGDKVKPGDVVMKIEGAARGILTGERTALNFLQRLSGVATLTAKFVAAVHPHHVKVLDTRKTTPGLRHLQKEAVVAGGGTNHRIGLYDMVMVKDNHLISGGDDEAIQNNIHRVKAAHPQVRIELEVDNLTQLKRFLQLEGVDVILLDNMSNARLREAVAINQGRVELEASGGVNLQTICGIATTGVDAISVGALTHSAPALDLSLEFVAK